MNGNAIVSHLFCLLILTTFCLSPSNIIFRYLILHLKNPFCRFTLEGVCYKNEKAMELLGMIETPSFALVAKSFSVQNLSKSTHSMNQL